MKNRVKVTIGGRDFTLLAAEDEQYVQKVAAHVEKGLLEMIQSAHLSLTDAAVMTAVNIADEYFKTLESAEHLRSQMKEYLEESSKMKQELAETKRTLLRLQQEKKKA